MTKPRSRDILETLQEAITQEPLRADTADSNVNVFAIKVPMPIGVIEDAIAEIKRLRTMAGAVSAGESFADIRQTSRMSSGIQSQPVPCVGEGERS